MSLLRIAHGLLVCALVFSADAAVASAGGSASAVSTENVKKLHPQLNTTHEKVQPVKKHP